MSINITYSGFVALSVIIISNSCTHKVRTQETLNKLKNRHSLPQPTDINKGISISSFFYSNDNGDKFNEDSAATITGYLLKVKEEKGESCNGYSKNPEDWDYHIYIAADSNARSIKETVIAEVTPYTRSIHPEYTLRYLRRLKGQKVTITGWILYDFEHLDVSDESHADSKKDYRRTVYEIHPITDIELAN